VRTVTDDSFERDVLGAGRPVVVDFWAPWCEPCKAVEPILEALAAEHASVEFVRMDVDANPLTAAGLGVLTLPTATLFSGGGAQASVAGARSRTEYERAWASWLEAAPQSGDS
jgi:thioredoxin 1